MRSDEHIEMVLSAVELLWKNGDNRHLRLGQLIDVIAITSGRDAFTIPDTDLMVLAKEMKDTGV